MEQQEALLFNLLGHSETRKIRYLRTTGHFAHGCVLTQSCSLTIGIIFFIFVADVQVFGKEHDEPCVIVPR